MAFDRKSYMRKWFQDHKDDPKFKAKRKQSNDRWRETPERREEARQRVSKWRRKHPEYGRMYVKKNKERLRKYNILYLKNNPEKARSWTQKRRAMLRKSTSGNCSQTIKLLMRESNCYWCTLPFDLVRRVHIDHVIPISRGGKHISSNLVASCSTCNNSKRNKFYWEWDGELAS